ncbi:MAG: ABC transporter ATP-binding protein [Beijerinckiaceae bacterium]
MASLTISNIAKAYGSVAVLNDISLTINSGEFFTLLGPSGCGKTTLLRMIAGFLNQDVGSIYIDSEHLDPVPAHKRDIGMVFQDYAIFPHLTVAENVAFGLKTRGLPRDDIRLRVAESLQMVQLGSLGDRYPSEISGGQQQRVGLARAMAIRPRLLLMDEPLSNLDAKLRLELREVIHDLQKRMGITTIYVTHDQEEALAISDRICVMNGGIIEQVGTPFEIYRNPARQFVAAFVGTMNVFSGEIKTGRLFITGTPTKLTTSASDGPVIVAIRPENINLSKAKMAKTHALSGTTRKTTFLGREAHYTIDTPVGEIIAQMTDPQHNFSHANGNTITLQFPLDRMLVFSPDGCRMEMDISPAESQQ